MKRFLILLVLLFSSIIGAQEELLEDESLSNRYRLQILETATLSELQALARESGLSDSGSISVLINRLKSHYGIVENADENTMEETEKGSPMLVTIESAKSTRSIQVIEKDGQELMLEGEVLLRIEQEENNTEHLIYADRIVFSRITDQVSAFGNIHYIKIENGEEESFYGDSLTFLMQGWKGIIFNALSQRTDEQEDQTVEFFFQGSQFKSSGSDTFIMERGRISSGDPEELYYHIRARKIWILGPQEWGLLSGVFYIGRVPLLYMPLYYRPGNEMIINPVMGYRDREGTVIQTTLYLFGRKESDNQSFFNAGIVTDDEYELTREGLFLFKGEKLDNLPNNNTLKVMFDWYSRMGYYSGLYGYNKNENRTMEFRSAVAFSHSIGNSGEIYFEDSSGVLSTRPNKTYFYGLELPFRWELEFSVKWSHLNISLEYLTDSSFRRDFHQRKESFDWLNWLLEERVQDYTEDSLTTSLLWSVNYKNNFRIPNWQPYVNRMDIHELSLNLYFSQDVDEALKLEDPFNPAVNYFYPNNIIPRLTLNSSGTLLSKTFPIQEELSSFVNQVPVPEIDEEDIVPDSSIESLYPVEIQKSIPLADAEKSSISLSWKLSPKWSMDTPFLSENWESAEDIDMELNYAEFLSVINGSLNYSYKALNNLFVFTGQNELVSHYKDYKDLMNNLGEPDQELILNENLFNDLNWKNSLDFQMYPLKYLEDFSSSKLSYKFNNKIYSWGWNAEDQEHSSKWFGFKDEMIELSQYSIQTVYQPLNSFKAVCSYTGENYPDRNRNKQDINASLHFLYGPFSQDVKQSANWRPEEDWKMGTFSSNSTLSFWDSSLLLSNNLSADMDEHEISSNTLTLKLWRLNFSANWINGPIYTWDDVNYQWDKLDEDFHLETITTNFTLDEELPLMWKNRISQKVNTSLNWSMNMNQVNNNKLSFALGYTLGIYKFMDLHFNVTSSNNSMFIYFERFREELGIDEDRSMLQDLFNSFAFFDKNQQLRKDSFFNMQTINITATHYMGNWTAFLEYTGKPDVESGVTQWDSTFSFLVQWIPINSIKSKIEMDEEEEWTATTEWED